MKKLICCLSVLVCLCLCASALAEPTIRQFDSSVTVNKTTDVLSVYDEETRTYALMTAEGEILTQEAYYSMGAQEYGLFKVEVASEDGVHDEGLIDSTGRVIIPPEYADIEIISDRWQSGVKLTPCSADDKDYTFSSMSLNNNTVLFFRIDTVDFFFDGQKVGTLSRSDYSSYPTAYGAYICVMDRERNNYYYNSAMEKSPVTDGYGEYSSYYQDDDYVYIHNGSGQQAFVPECTLTADEVNKSMLVNEDVVIDLQGNEIGRTNQVYKSITDIGNGYYSVSIYDDNYNSKYGVIDKNLTELVPTVYDKISNIGSSLTYGYIGVEKDGKFGYVDVNGNVTCDFVYSANAVQDRGTFASIKNLDGTIIVLSAAVGELPEHYAEVYFVGYEGCMAFGAKNADGAWGVVGLYGQTLVPFSADNKYITDISYDGRVVIITDTNYKYVVYTFDEADLAAPAALEPAA